jgi:hypothetical protein
MFTYEDCQRIEKAYRRQPSKRSYTKAEVEAEVNRQIEKAMGGSVPGQLPSGSLDRAKARMDDVLTHGAAARHELDKIDFQGRDVQGKDMRALDPATDATMPAAKAAQAMRKQAAFDRIDKSDQRLLGTAMLPAGVYKAAEIERSNPIPGRALTGLPDTDPTTADANLSRLKADPTTSPLQMALAGYEASRQAEVLADPRKGWH